MKDTFIIAFPAGASGRFISAIVYSLIHSSNDPLEWTNVNSAHDFIDNKRVWDTGEFQPKQLLNSSLFYKHFSFKAPGVAHTHCPPDFESLRTRLRDTKLIIISIDDDDLDEIKLNVIQKNPIGINGTGPYIWWASSNNPQLKYINYERHNNVPDGVLLLRYKEIFQSFNDSYVALEKLKLFTGNMSNSTIDSNYRKYVANREKIISTLPQHTHMILHASMPTLFLEIEDHQLVSWARDNNISYIVLDGRGVEPSDIFKNGVSNVFVGTNESDLNNWSSHQGVSIIHDSSTMDHLSEIYSEYLDK